MVAQKTTIKGIVSEAYPFKDLDNGKQTPNNLIVQEEGKISFWQSVLPVEEIGTMLGKCYTFSIVSSSTWTDPKNGRVVINNMADGFKEEKIERPEGAPPVRTQQQNITRNMVTKEVLVAYVHQPDFDIGSLIVHVDANGQGLALLNQIVNNVEAIANGSYTEDMDLDGGELAVLNQIFPPPNQEDQGSIVETKDTKIEDEGTLFMPL